MAGDEELGGRSWGVEKDVAEPRLLAGFPTPDPRLPSPVSRLPTSPAMPISETILRLGWLFDAWVFALGGIVGSFLNVVVYRLPAGKSIVHPGSHCPNCGHAIRGRHNLPILGWLLLGGLCYDCRHRISIRYPLVELTLALLFLAIAHADIWPALSHYGQPHGNINQVEGWLLLTRWAFHSWLIATLLAAALIDFDGHPASWNVLAMAALIGAAVTVLSPAVHQADLAAPIATWLSSIAWFSESAAKSISVAGVGAAAGLAVGGVYDRLMGRRSDGGRSRNWGVLACLGLFLGWQSAMAAGLAGTLGTLLARLVAKRSTRIGWIFTALVLTSACAWILVVLPCRLIQ